MPVDTHAMISVFLLCCLFDFAPAAVLWVLYRHLRGKRKRHTRQ